MLSWCPLPPQTFTFHLCLICVFCVPASAHCPIEVWIYSQSRDCNPISLRFHFHIPTSRPYEVSTDETKTDLVKTVAVHDYSSLLIIDIDRTTGSLPDTWVKIWVVFLFQIRGRSPSFSCWRKLASVPENRIALKWSNKLSKSFRQEEASVLSNVVHICSLKYPHHTLLYSASLQGFLFCFAASSHLTRISISPTQRP